MKILENYVTLQFSECFAFLTANQVARFRGVKGKDEAFSLRMCNDFRNVWPQSRSS